MTGGPRFSIIPYQFFDDTRPKMSHVRVMASLCRHTNRSGWCRLRQTSIGKEAGVGRQAVNRALADLVKWGHVEIHAEGKGQSNLYRVIMDSRKEPPADLPEEDILPVNLSPGDDTPLTPADDRGVAPGGDRGVAYRGDTNNEYLTNTKRKNAPTGASADCISDLKSEGAAAWTEITPDDKEAWTRWVQFVVDRKGWAASRDFGRARCLRVATRLPKPNSPLPDIPKPPSHIIAGPAKAEARA